MVEHVAIAPLCTDATKLDPLDRSQFAEIAMQATERLPRDSSHVWRHRVVVGLPADKAFSELSHRGFGTRLRRLTAADALLEQLLHRLSLRYGRVVARDQQ